MIIRGRHTLVPNDAVANVQLSFGAFCSVASGLRIVSGQHPGVEAPEAISDFPFNEHGWGDYPPSNMGEGVTVGNDVWIGEGVTLLDGIHVGDGARVGACAVVTRDVRPYSMVAGNPARERGLRFRPEQIAALQNIAWWEWTDTQIESRLPDMANVHHFITKFNHPRMKGTT